jgi:hypothetical protein
LFQIQLLAAVPQLLQCHLSSSGLKNEVRLDISR